MTEGGREGTIGTSGMGITGGIFLIGRWYTRFTLHTAMDTALGVTGIVVRAPVTKGRRCRTIVTSLVRGTGCIDMGLVLFVKGPHFEIIVKKKFHVLIIVEFVRVASSSSSSSSRVVNNRRNRCCEAANDNQSYPKDVV
jgi:hypothetical protein